jgi:DNA-binding NarL/FixJ family response regulator
MGVFMEKVSMPVVFLVEDCPFHVALMKAVSRDKFILLSAESLAQAYELFQESSADIGLAVVDARMRDTRSNTMELIVHMRLALPDLEILVNSSDEDNLSYLQQAGASGVIGKCDLVPEFFSRLSKCQLAHL